MQNHQSAAGSRRQGSSVLFLAQAAVIAALYTVLISPLMFLLVRKMAMTFNEVVRV